MEEIMIFLNIIAWVVGIASSIVLLLRILGAATYSEVDQIRDKMNGIRRTWPVMWPGLIALICWAFIIAF